MDRHDLFLKVDGRGNAHMRELENGVEDWLRMVKSLVDGSR